MHFLGACPRFSRLPACVKVILTSRPHTSVAFTAWQPHGIEPQAEQNLADMRMILEVRLADAGCVQPSHVPGAVDVLLEKSEVGQGCCCHNTYRAASTTLT